MKLKFLRRKSFGTSKGTAVGEEGFSKVKVGALLVAAAVIVTTVGNFLTGDLTLLAALTSLVTDVGAFLAALGVRDLPFLNTSK
jgi:hypothetical protein